MQWMVIEARKLAEEIQSLNASSQQYGDVDRMLQSLNALGYDEAAQHVYGMNYGDWKKRHMKKATDDQMERFEASKPLWAKHDKELLEKRGENPPPPGGMAQSKTMAPSLVHSSSTQLASNVCCQDLDGDKNKDGNPSAQQLAPPIKTSRTRTLPEYQPPPPPSRGVEFALGILTVSDRASSGMYETGDLSGPAVVKAVDDALQSLNNVGFSTSRTVMAIVPDDINSIQEKLKQWSDQNSSSDDPSPTMDLILTTGGTGFAPRDVTPEATMGVLDRPCPGLVAFCTAECSKLQPLASLSRGTAGLRNKTLIVNLPGNPKGVGEIIPILLPLVLHCLHDLQHPAEF